MGKQKTVCLPVPGKQKCQMVAVTEKHLNNSYIYFDNSEKKWHAVGNPKPETVDLIKKFRYNFHACELINCNGVDDDVMEKRLWLRNEMKPPKQKKRRWVKMPEEEKKKRELQKQLAKQERLRSSALVAPFKPETVAAIEKRYMQIYKKQLDGKPLSQRDKDFMERYG